MLEQARRGHVAHREAKSATGWRPPRNVTARRKLLEKCGPGAFLLIERTKTGLIEPKFPVMNQSCAVDCRGALVALRRAAQYGYTEVERKARALAKRGSCRWA